MTLDQTVVRGPLSEIFIKSRHGQATINDPYRIASIGEPDMKNGAPTHLSKLMLIGGAVLLLVAVVIVAINWDPILDWLIPAGRGK